MATGTTQHAENTNAGELDDTVVLDEPPEKTSEVSGKLPSLRKPEKLWDAAYNEVRNSKDKSDQKLWRHYENILRRISDTPGELEDEESSAPISQEDGETRKH